MKRILARALAPWFFVLCMTTSALCQFPAGETAPNFKLPDLDGKTVQLLDYEDRPIVLVIGTTWCPGCKTQLSELEKISRFFDDNQIPVLDVFIQERPKTVRKYLKGKKLPAAFKALLDDGQVHRAYQVYPIPRLLILDGSRHVVQDSLGLDSAEIVRILETLLPRRTQPPDCSQ